VLTITRLARETIRAILDAPELPDSAGLRISTQALSWNGSGPPITIDIAVEAQPGDEVVEEDGAQVFIAPAVAEALERKELDADIEADGDLRFELRDRL
jgi:iron-sulfur cluster assembly protein